MRNNSSPDPDEPSADSATAGDASSGPRGSCLKPVLTRAPPQVTSFIKGLAALVVAAPAAARNHAGDISSGIGLVTATGEADSNIRLIHRSIMPLLLALMPLVLFVGTAAAQSAGSAFCGTNMAETIQNIFILIQFGGPLIGGVLALGATVALPFVRRSDWKKEMKGMRNQGLLWGVIVAPLGTEIVQFLLNNVVVGGTSCGF